LLPIVPEKIIHSLFASSCLLLSFALPLLSGYSAWLFCHLLIYMIYKNHNILSMDAHDKHFVSALNHRVKTIIGRLQHYLWSVMANKHLLHGRQVLEHE